MENSDLKLILISLCIMLIALSTIISINYYTYKNLETRCYITITTTNGDIIKKECKRRNYSYKNHTNVICVNGECFTYQKTKVICDE